MNVSRDLKIFDLTHDIPAFNIWEASYRLRQTIEFWPKGTVFVSIVDPGVGSARKSIVAKTASGHFIVTPDNGTLTLIHNEITIDEIRLIDEKTNRLPSSQDSYTFHGRDVYAFTGARLASGKITFEEVGPKLSSKPITLSYQQPKQVGDSLLGSIDILDIQYGNVWTNIPVKLLNALSIQYGDSLQVRILHDSKEVYAKRVSFGRTFADVATGRDVAYLNSLMKFSLAINLGDFAKKHGIGSGPGWSIILKK